MAVSRGECSFLGLAMDEYFQRVLPIDRGFLLVVPMDEHSLFVLPMDGWSYPVLPMVDWLPLVLSIAGWKLAVSPDPLLHSVLKELLMDNKLISNIKVKV